MNTKKLKELVLDLAIHGKLVPQDPNDEPASVLLARIQAEKAKTAKGKQAATFEPIEDVPFDEPEGWCWCTIGDIFAHNTGKALNKSQKQEGQMLSYITTSNVYWDYFDMSDVKEMIFTESEIEKCTVTKGDLLVCEGGDIGRSAIWEYDYDIRIQNHLHRLRSYCGCSHKLYKYVLQLYKWQNRIEGKGIGLMGLSSNALDKLLIPLPPLAEQQRIVAEIERWFKVIDALEGNEGDLLKSIEQTKKKVLDLAIHGKLVPQDPNDEPADVLLKKLILQKQQLLRTKQIQNKVSNLPLYIEDFPFDLPSNWEWAQLSDISLIQEGAGILKKQYRDSGIQLMCVTNILNGSIDMSKKQLFIDKSEFESKYSHLSLNKGDIVCSCSGGSWGKVAIFEEDNTIMLNTSTLRLRFWNDLGFNKYLYYVCQTKFFKNDLELQLVGLQPNFGYYHYSKLCIPLPPLAEQQRIVAKIEQILGVLDNIKTLAE